MNNEPMFQKTRLIIIALLRQRRWTVKELADHIGAESKQAVKYHLLNLMKRGIAQRAKRPDTPELKRAHEYWIG
jgi:predicted ArsR family transcriptional regulator